MTARPASASAPSPSPAALSPAATLAIGLSAVIVSTGDAPETMAAPRILTVRAPGSGRDALPAGPLESHHRSLATGLRAWVERRSAQRLGYVEQLYTFSNRDRTETDGAGAENALSVCYLALTRDRLTHDQSAPGESLPAEEAHWRDWYDYLPWEDWRDGRPALLDRVERRLGLWAESGDGPPAACRIRRERIRLAFGTEGTGWNEERALERYELLYEAGLVEEAHRDRRDAAAAGLESIPGLSMALDHRRMLATALARLRGKIKYRPVVFELMPPTFTLLQLQRTVEALAGLRLHKQNFRRLVEQQGLVEETGLSTAGTGGRPARLVRFRPEVLLERPAPGLRAGRTRS